MLSNMYKEGLHTEVQTLFFISLGISFVRKNVVFAPWIVRKNVLFLPLFVQKNVSLHREYVRKNVDQYYGTTDI